MSINLKYIYTIKKENESDSLTLIPLGEFNDTFSFYEVDKCEIINLKENELKRINQIGQLTQNQFKLSNKLSRILFLKQYSETIEKNLIKALEIEKNKKKAIKESLDLQILEMKNILDINKTKSNKFNIKEFKVDMLTIPKILKFHELGIINFDYETVEIAFAPENIIPKDTEELMDAFINYDKEALNSTNKEINSFIDYLRVVVMFSNYEHNTLGLKKSLGLHTGARQLVEVEPTLSKILFDVIPDGLYSTAPLEEILASISKTFTDMIKWF